jgi:HAMP domain-containing protein
MVPPEAGLESKTALWVTGVAAIVLLIACANVTNILVARVLRRRRETAVRLALGVSRGRLLLQSLTECLVLAALGCAVGLAIAQAGSAAISRLFAREGTVVSGGVDGPMVAVAAAVALRWCPDASPPACARTELAEPQVRGATQATLARPRDLLVLRVPVGAAAVSAGLFVRARSGAISGWSTARPGAGGDTVPARRSSRQRRPALASAGRRRSDPGRVRHLGHQHSVLEPSTRISMAGVDW